MHVCVFCECDAIKQRLNTQLNALFAYVRETNRLNTNIRSTHMHIIGMPREQLRLSVYYDTAHRI